jgi:structural maintenance of chromosome 2
MLIGRLSKGTRNRFFRWREANHLTKLIFVLIRSFDPHFNAITGLNGSGKSNILDAICFVLGITNLSQVRAGSLAELVYKQGQAGVTKASVTIVFNNDDRENSPVGFEEHHEVTVTRQVMMGGKSKYLINGRNSPANAVQNLFHSVQLNVNNPHFLIMQGRITKVLNMKPNEILGMIEEAAGTRMYENKRIAAIKMIDKKDVKVDEINKVLEEEITPTLERLRGEKENYLKWSKNSADVERLERFCIAHQFYSAQKALQTNQGDVELMEQEVETLEEKATEYQELVSEKDKEIAETFTAMKGDMDEQLSQTRTLKQERSNELVRITSKWKNLQETASKAESDVATAEALVTETASAVSAKEKQISEETEAVKETLEAAANAEQKLHDLTEEYQAISAGISKENRSLPEQISQAHADSQEAGAKAEQASLRVAHLTRALAVRYVNLVRHV